MLMRTRSCRLSCFRYLGFAIFLSGCSYGDSVVDFELTLPDLPDGLGVAGPIAGRSGRMFVVAGGANFPHQPRWESDKVWYDRVMILDLQNPEAGWRTSPTTLKRPCGYGVSLSHATFGIVAVGGADSRTHFDEAFLLHVDPGTYEVHSEALAALPMTLAFATGVLLGDQVCTNTHKQTHTHNTHT